MQTDATKPELFPVPIWRCRDHACRAWVREELSSTTEPACPICTGSMIRSFKHLPKLVKKHKAVRKKTEETQLLH